MFYFQANWTFQAVADSISAGHWWLKYSKMVQSSINSQNFTSRLEYMKALFNLWNKNEVKDSLGQPGLFDYDRSLIENFDVDKTTKKLKFADYVVKAWLDKIENITLDNFLGFNTSKDLESFMMNRSSMPKYKDRKVIAGKCFIFHAEHILVNLLPLIAASVFLLLLLTSYLFRIPTSPKCFSVGFSRLIVLP
jgi:hypothetical protein